VDDVRTAAILSLAARFTTWETKWALRRAEIVADLLKQFKMRVHPEIRSAVQHAAMLLDIGRSLDFFDRYEHAAEMVMDTELDGFTHDQIALLSSIIANAGDEDARPHSYKPLLDKYNLDDIECVAMVLRLADEIQQRSPRGRPVRIRSRISRREVTISGVGLGGWTLRGVGARFHRLFGRELKAKSF
jgi:exopolyphosphatase/guanosine-5'-triphosphate,3'-diphosphate pyrophosphatase